MKQLSARYTMWAVAVISLLLSTACTSGKPRERGDFLQDSRPIATTLVYECLGYEFIARVGPGEMAVWLADDYLVLSQVRAAKGIRYEEGDTVFTLQDDDVVLTVDGERYPDCVLAPSRAPWEDARRRGVSFRAVGNEPGWYLEIQPGRQILYVGEYGMNRVLVPNPGPEETATGQRYHVITENNDLLLDVETSACTDTMKGDSFPATVLLTVNNKRLRGCGRPLDYPWR